MLQKCAGIRTYTEVLPESNITAFHKGDILLNNIRPYLQKIWYATFSGGCSNDVLVLRTKNDKQHNSAFYASFLKRQAFFDYIMQDVNGVKMPRGKKTHIMNYRVPNISLAEQNELVFKIKEIELLIREAEKTLEILSGQTEDILAKYLK